MTTGLCKLTRRWKYPTVCPDTCGTVRDRGHSNQQYAPPQAPSPLQGNQPRLPHAQLRQTSGAMVVSTSPTTQTEVGNSRSYRGMREWLYERGSERSRSCRLLPDHRMGRQGRFTSRRRFPAQQGRAGCYGTAPLRGRRHSTLGLQRKLLGRTSVATGSDHIDLPVSTYDYTYNAKGGRCGAS